jgi:hypothetical protein
MGNVLDALKRKRALTPKKARAPPKPDKEISRGCTLRRLKMQRKPEPAEEWIIGKEKPPGEVPGVAPIAPHLSVPKTKKDAVRALANAERSYEDAERNLVSAALDPEAPLERYLEARLRLRRMKDSLVEARRNHKQYAKG